MSSNNNTCITKIIIITLANKKILAYKVSAVLRYIGGDEFENDPIFFRLALVFEIFQYLGLFYTVSDYF